MSTFKNCNCWKWTFFSYFVSSSLKSLFANIKYKIYFIQSVLSLALSQKISFHMGKTNAHRSIITMFIKGHWAITTVILIVSTSENSILTSFFPQRETLGIQSRACKTSLVVTNWLQGHWRCHLSLFIAYRSSEVQDLRCT